MNAEDSEAKLRTWVEGFGRFGGNSNPDISLSNSVIASLQTSAKLATPKEVAEDFRRFAIAKGFSLITQERFMMIMRSEGWSTFFDPFVSSVSKSSLVFRGNWNDAWEVSCHGNVGGWIINKVDLDSQTKFDGWRSVIPALYLDYVENCRLVNRRTTEKLEYAKNWLTCGLKNLRSEIMWMHLFSGPTERDQWLTVSGDITVLKGWLASGLDPNESKKMMELEFEPIEARSIANISTLDVLTKWINAGFAREIILEFICLSISLEAAQDWRDRKVIALSKVSEWHRNGIVIPSEAEDWASYGFHPQEAAAWMENGFNSASEAEVWRSVLDRADLAKLLLDQGCKIKEIDSRGPQRWVILHDNSGKEICYKELREVENLSPSSLLDVLKDMEVSEFSAPEIVQWRSFDFNLNEYRLWIAQGIKPAIAQRYRKCNFGPIQTKQLLEKKIPPTHALEKGIVPSGE